MADTTFVAKVTHILATWLNDVNKSVYRAIGAGGVAPQTPADVLTNLGLSASGGAALIGNNTGGGTTGANVQVALDGKLPIVNPTFIGTLTGANGYASNITYYGLLNRIDSAGAISLPRGFSTYGSFIGRYATSGTAPAVNSASYTVTHADSTSVKDEWANLTRLDNYANAGENVAVYGQAYKNAAGPSWAGVFEAHDTTHVQPSQALYGIEIDVSANGTDVNVSGYHTRFGAQIVGYRDNGITADATVSISNGSGGAGTTMTVLATYQGRAYVGQLVSGSGIAANTYITAGLGGGQWTVSQSQLVTSQDVLLRGVYLASAQVDQGPISFQGKIDNGSGSAGTKLTVSSIVSGSLAFGQLITGAGVSANTVISGQVSGTSGSTGVYSVTVSQLVTPAETMTATGAVLGNVLTVNSVDTSGAGSGQIVVGMQLWGAGVLPGTTVTAFGTGTGGTGTYTVSNGHLLVAAPMSLSNVSSTGGVNVVGYGIYMGPNYQDPGGSTFTNGILLAGSGDSGIVMSGFNQVGVGFVGNYSTAPIESITPSAVPVITTIGSANSALIEFASTDPMCVGLSGAMTAQAGAMRVIVDGISRFIPFYGTNAQVTASIVGHTMTVTATASGSVAVGDFVTGNGVNQNTVVTSSSGGGVYIVNIFQNVASTTMFCGRPA